MQIQNNYQINAMPHKLKPSFGVKINRGNFYEFMAGGIIEDFDRTRNVSIGKLLDVYPKNIKVMDDESLTSLIKKIGSYIIGKYPEHHWRYLHTQDAIKNGKLLAIINKVKALRNTYNIEIDKNTQDKLRKEFDLKRIVIMRKRD